LKRNDDVIRSTPSGLLVMTSNSKKLNSGILDFTCVRIWRDVNASAISILVNLSFICIRIWRNVNVRVFRLTARRIIHVFKY